MSDEPVLVPVRILGLPLDIYRRSSEHNDELLREFALLREDNTDQVPVRLLALVEELRGRFSGFTQGQTLAMQEALARGDKEIDLFYEVPPDASDGALRLAALLQEADDFCRAGDLLTLAALPEGVAFRTWFLDEFRRQIDGEPPRPWSVFLKESTTG